MDGKIKAMLIKALLTSSEEESKSILSLLRKKKIDWHKELSDAHTPALNSRIVYQKDPNSSQIIQYLHMQNQLYQQQIKALVEMNQRQKEAERSTNIKVLINSIIVIFLLLVLFFMY